MAVQTRHIFLSGHGCFEKTVQFILGEGEKFVRLDNIQNPPRSYLVEYTNIAGVNALQAGMGGPAQVNLVGILAIGHAAQANAMHVAMGDRLIEVRVKGGSSSCWCFGTTSNIQVSITVEAQATREAAFPVAVLEP
jgi:hypothetical protein